jgi:hypothetical protein
MSLRLFQQKRGTMALCVLKDRSPVSLKIATVRGGRFWRLKCVRLLRRSTQHYFMRERALLWAFAEGARPVVPQDANSRDN